MLVSEDSAERRELLDLVFELTKRSAAFNASLPKGLAEPLADFVRSMNCYYSNKIEGRNTHPVDIERALHSDFDRPGEKRDLQLEAKAHIEVQRWIDEGGLAANESTISGVCEIHQRFVDLLPEDLRWVQNPDTGERIRLEPGALRTRDVQVGRHVAISPGAVPRFLRRFEACYSRLRPFEAILATAAAHHRLLYIHPFADGNGRVTRLMSYATLRRSLETGGLWSVARGLARKEAEYKGHLASCDQLRRGDRDGRGLLSHVALANFTRFFLEICLDQTAFMRDLMQPGRLRDRILAWATEEVGYGRLPDQAIRVLDAILFRGSLPKSEVVSVIGQSERTARLVTNALSREGIIAAEGVRGEWRLAFPARLAPRITPGLYPE
ncbi:MAG: Fic family protein [Caulobacterales bacterium]